MNIAEFENFLETYEKDIYSFCLYLTQNLQEAEDLYQEVVLFAFERRADISFETNIAEGKNPKSYMLAVAAGKWKNISRKRIRRAKIVPEIPLDPELNIADTNHNKEPGYRLEQKEIQACINRGLNALKEKLRIPLIMYYYDDFSVGEIAKALKVPEGTIKSRLHKGRKTLEKFLEKEGFTN
ncbi:MAG: RNA polymerase sigma factor [Defluviitaleaceae bacterium]|nr:RNA polymerase sigma factor [Defluviitaleaceae bacterium]